MEKYLEALVHVEDNVSVPTETETMPVYLENLRENKNNLLNNFSICSMSITLNEESIKLCLIELATSSLRILSAMKNASPRSIIASNAELFEKKNADYGNSFVDFGLIGIVVRLNDKINRILNLNLLDGEQENIQVVDEKIEDTINDLYNYCIIGLMYA